MADERKVHVALRQKASASTRYLYFSVIAFSAFSSGLTIVLKASPDRIILSVVLFVAVVGSISMVRRRNERFKDGEVVFMEGQPYVLMPPSNYYSLDPKVVNISRAKERFLVLTVVDPNSRNPGRNYRFDLRFDDSSDREVVTRRLTNWGLEVS